jgi:hypothetical protein
MTRLSLALLPFLAAGPMFAATITIDENGNGLPHVLGTDPGPGGLTGVLIYTLPFTGLQGDVHLTDAECGGCFLDVLRFNANGTVIFYSDNIDGFDSIGDTTGPPGSAYTNLVSIAEVGPEGNNGAFYTPTANQPGFDSSNPTYHFISDGTAVPEPSSMSLMIAGLGALSYRWIRSKRRA